ncbi:MAG: hypothetical protein BWY55_00638 [archaeon ADurb.Bin336]|nr:MAG: hypothetical protein BWY55_00638 [archaeon ADurb.Bin336]
MFIETLYGVLFCASNESLNEWVNPSGSVYVAVMQKLLSSVVASQSVSIPTVI